MICETCFSEIIILKHNVELIVIIDSVDVVIVFMIINIEYLVKKYAFWFS